MAPAAAHRPPVVLVVSAAEQFFDELLSGLGAGGCAVLRARSGGEALEQACNAEPDAVVIDADLPDMSDLDLCRRLRREPRIGSATAILLTSALLPPRDRRLAALQAGGWQILAVPIDFEELLLKVRCYTEAKILAHGAAQAGTLVDPETGLYNLQGLARRAEELGALAARAQGSLACVVLAPETEDDTPTPPHELTTCCARAIRTGTRHSDVGGRVATTRLAELARRLAPGGGGGGTPRGLRLHTAYEAVGNLAHAPINPVDLLMRARRAQRSTQAESSSAS